MYTRTVRSKNRRHQPSVVSLFYIQSSTLNSSTCEVSFFVIFGVVLVLLIRIPYWGHDVALGNVLVQYAPQGCQAKNQTMDLFRAVGSR